MTMQNPEAILAESPNQSRKPRLALMGEFSAGKSTLSNTLLGCAPLPVRVTATSLPPVWIAHGPQAAAAVGQDGTETPISVEELATGDFSDCRMIRLWLEADALELCDLIDMPGISDPNMTADRWQPMLDEIDSVVWCTHSTQAWRQSEAAVWERVRGVTNGDNILLLTQIDKLRSERDRTRVMARLRKETSGIFKGIYPVSLLQALAAGDDEAKWRESGAMEFLEHLIEMLMRPSPKSLGATVQHITPTVPPAAPVAEAPVLEEVRTESVMPKRVKPVNPPVRPARPTNTLELLDQLGRS